MELYRFDSIDKFWDKAQTYLQQNEAENSVLLGVINTLLRNPARYPDPPYLVIVETNEKAIATAIRTLPHKLLLSKASNPDALNVIARDLDRELLPGVMGLVPEVEIFLQVWEQLTGQSAGLPVATKIHQLTAVNSIAPVPGKLRLATESDRALLIEWLPAFIAEIGEVMGTDLERVVNHRLQTQSTYIWEDNIPVSLAAGREFPPTVGRIGSVYTPPEHRRKGYATACVAALSQKLLDDGCDRCFLLTDLANPTSNHIYQAIGYVPICDWNEYSFISKDLE
jgi:uncharacterized protein